MSDKYKFYYDESEHSRKINKTTISSENYYDNFVAAIVGWKPINNEKISQKYKKFEKKYKNRWSKGELKSTTIRTKYLKHGFASLNKDNVEFVNDFLNLFDEDIYLYFSVISKIEYVINQLFQDYRSNSDSFVKVNMEAMKYSIVKFLILYRPVEIIEGMYDNTVDFVGLLLQFFHERIEANKVNPELKSRESEACKQIILLLEDINKSFEIEWNYRTPFSGFCLYVKEMSIDDYMLYIDEEGSASKTLHAACSVGIPNVYEINSKESVGIRFADMFIGLFAKLLKAIHNDLAYTSISDGINKKILNKEWFHLSDEKLALYKKFDYIISKLNNAWYKSYGGNYSDDLITLSTLINFISQFECVDDMKGSAKKSVLSEQFNNVIVTRMQEYFIQMGFE